MGFSQNVILFTWDSFSGRLNKFEFHMKAFFMCFSNSFPLCKRKSSCWRNLQISPAAVGPGPAPGGPTEGYCFLGLINESVLHISQREHWCCSYPLLPEIWHWVKFAFISHWKASELKKQNKTKQSMNLILVKRSGQNTEEWTEHRLQRQMLVLLGSMMLDKVHTLSEYPFLPL